MALCKAGRVGCLGVVARGPLPLPAVSLSSDTGPLHLILGSTPSAISPPRPPGKICLSRPRLSLKPPILLHVFPLHFVHLFLFLLYLSPKFTDLKLLIACFYLALEIKGLMNFSLGNFLILADSQKCDAAIANASD